MKGVAINETTIVGDDGKYYKFSFEDVRSGRPSGGERVAFRPDGAFARDVFVIADEGEKRATKDVRSEETKAALKESAAFGRARMAGIASGVAPAVIKLYAFFIADYAGLKLQIAVALAVLVGALLTYAALGGIARLAGSDDLHVNYGKAMIAMFVAQVTQTLAFYLAQTGHPLARLVAVIAALLLVYVAVVWAKVFFKLARLTRNGLFRVYVCTFFAGELLWASGVLAVFGFLLLVASFFIYIAAWVKTDKVGEAKDAGLFIY